MSYKLLINLHITTALISLLLFLFRGIWVLRYGQHSRPRWMKWLPHVNDTLLFVLGIALMLTIQQYPIVNAWLTAKLTALIIYILLGMVVMKWAKQRRSQFIAWLSALVVFSYMVGVAITKQPWIFT
ncbi:MAG: SirB2 family protein [Gammaproteobacteria bacterium]|nr:SirB2 family protein [Gammaproteobacteria bacterium]